MKREDLMKDWVLTPFLPHFPLSLTMTVPLTWHNPVVCQNHAIDA